MTEREKLCVQVRHKLCTHNPPEQRIAADKRVTVSQIINFIQARRLIPLYTKVMSGELQGQCAFPSHARDNGQSNGSFSINKEYLLTCQGTSLRRKEVKARAKTKAAQQ